VPFELSVSEPYWPASGLPSVPLSGLPSSVPNATTVRVSLVSGSVSANAPAEPAPVITLPLGLTPSMALLSPPASAADNKSSFAVGPSFAPFTVIVRLALDVSPALPVRV
jgi:hypothetical protein